MLLTGTAEDGDKLVADFGKNNLERRLTGQQSLATEAAELLHDVTRKRRKGREERERQLLPPFSNQCCTRVFTTALAYIRFFTTLREERANQGSETSETGGQLLGPRRLQRLMWGAAVASGTLPKASATR